LNNGIFGRNSFKKKNKKMRKDPFLRKSFLCGGGDPFLEIDILVCNALGGMPSLRVRQFLD
jgi:hypothetical protein